MAPCPSEVPLALFLFHRGRLVAVDEPARSLRGPRDQHLLDDVIEGRCLALDRRRQWIAAEGAETHRAHLLDLTGLKWHPIVIAHDEKAVALYHRPRRCEIEWHHRDLLSACVLPDVELRPIGEGEYPDALALADSRVVEIPELRPLVAWIPDVSRGAEGEDALLGAALLFVA